MPTRVQLSRARAWRMPPNCVKVTRPGPYGNPFRVGGYFMIGDPLGTRGWLTMTWCESYAPDPRFTLIKDQAMAVDFFRRYVAKHPFTPEQLEKLRGKDLACWCKPGTPCHADVLIELANA